MARQPARHPPRLTVRRRFDPSRGQAWSLAFAFEQALPLIRRTLPTAKSEQFINSSDVNSCPRSSLSGAC
jgi:hypothetical protein